jgi:hypothetical protein
MFSPSHSCCNTRSPCLSRLPHRITRSLVHVHTNHANHSLPLPRLSSLRPRTHLDRQHILCIAARHSGFHSAHAVLGVRASSGGKCLRAQGTSPVRGIARLRAGFARGIVRA